MPGPIETRIRDLSSELFEPADLSAWALTPALKARSASFILLAHAEIEFAIETECRRTADLLLSASVPTTAIMAWGMFALSAESVSKKKLSMPSLELILERYSNVVNSNHGIKQANLEALLNPIGVRLSTATADIAVLEAFGRRRGDLAHQPIRNWLTTDLPSSHVTSGIQAGLSADAIVHLIQSGHSQITPASGGQSGSSKRLRRTIANTFRWAATKIDY
jgi:hypothetical protein